VADVAAPVTIDEQIACVEREIGFREKVYPRWVNKHPPKMTPTTMNLELSRMRAVLDTLRSVKARSAAAVQQPRVGVGQEGME
jgi:predicted oxidoreductase